MDIIIKNRNNLVQQLPFDQNTTYITAQQTHSDHIALIEKSKSRGWTDYEAAIPDCDAMITAQKGVVLTILTADCVPVLLYDPVHEVIGAVHAGWRGTEKNITGKTVEKMIDMFDINPKDLIVYIAPSIKRCCYEVGEEVILHFSNNESSNETFDAKGEKYMLDLPMINQLQLQEKGVILDNIETDPACTSCEVDHFFSYRKEQGCSGRFMSMIALTT